MAHGHWQEPVLGVCSPAKPWQAGFAPGWNKSGAELWPRLGGVSGQSLGLPALVSTGQCPAALSLLRPAAARRLISC